jgi:serine/threonine protein kinase
MNEINKPTVLENYSLSHILGKGTFSKVKLALNKKTKEKVAIKIIKKENMTDKDDLTRVKREIKILKNLRNPNVIEIENVLEDEKCYYIIMEYCGGGELFNYIVKNKRLSEDEASLFFFQIINGLESIHKYGIAHRDLKPENILLTDNKMLKVIDFGLSNHYKEGGSLLATPCGSPCYASPEMVAGNKYNGFMIDIWSAGIVLYAMVCGHLPFQDNDHDVLFERILECNVLFPDYVSYKIKDLIRKILVPDPDERIKIAEIKRHPVYLYGNELMNKKNTNIKKSTLSSYIKLSNRNKTDKIINLVKNSNTLKESFQKDNLQKYFNLSAEKTLKNSILIFPNKDNYIKIINQSKSKSKNKFNPITNSKYAKYLNRTVEKNYIITESSKRYNNTSTILKKLNNLNKTDFKTTFRDTIDMAKIYLNTATENKISKIVEKNKPVKITNLNMYNMLSIRSNPRIYKI